MTEKCAICGSRETSESTKTDKFQYGVTGEPGTVVISVEVPVIACGSCGEQYTDYRAEKLRDGAVRKHLASKGIYLCTVCGVNRISPEDGEDTCDACIGNV